MTARRKSPKTFLTGVKAEVEKKRQAEKVERLRALPGPWAVYQCTAHPKTKMESAPGQLAPSEMICPFCERRIKPRFVEIP